jgi:integrase
VVAVLEWHVDTQLTTPEQQRSDLLFPSVTGSFRAPTVLNKPFADVSEEMGLGYAFTQRGMRRTFNDLARNAGVGLPIVKSVSGHKTDRMVDHYSTISAAEQRAGIAKVVGLFDRKVART